MTGTGRGTGNETKTVLSKGKGRLVQLYLPPSTTNWGFLLQHYSSPSRIYCFLFRTEAHSQAYTASKEKLGGWGLGTTAEAHDVGGTIKNVAIIAARAHKNGRVE